MQVRIKVGNDSLHCRSAGAVQAAQEVLAQSLQSEQGVDMIFPDDNLPAYLGSQKTNGFNGHASMLETDLSGGLIASSISEHSTDNISDMFIDATTDAAGSLHSLRPSSPSVGGIHIAEHDLSCLLACHSLSHRVPSTILQI